ncbi:MAG: hypothetical protein NTW03_08645, partial [Verrucomicrobia bacterium]|nr:hypothetical protein [Verrucomicrobiota bacterium]
MRKTHGPNGSQRSARELSEVLVRDVAEQLQMLGFPEPPIIEHGDAETDPFDLDGCECATELSGQICIRPCAQELDLRGFPCAELGAGLEGWDLQSNPLIADLMVRTPKPSRQF